MMKTILLTIFVLSSIMGFTQDYVDILHTEYTTTPQNAFDTGSATTDLQKYNFNLTVPIKLKNSNAILTGLVYDGIAARLESNNYKPHIMSTILKVGMNIKHSDKWSTTVLFLPKIATDYTSNLSKKDFQIGCLGLVKMKKNEHLTYKFGAYMNGDLFGPFLVPLFGGYYKKDKLEMDVIIPSYAKINYSLKPKLTAGVNWRATVKSYNLHKFTGSAPNTNSLYDDDYLHHLSNEVAAHVDFEPVKGLIVRGMAGVSLGRSFRVYKNEDKIDFGLSLFRFGDARVQQNVDFANGAFFRAEIAYRVYL